MVGHAALDRVIGVRIPASQPFVTEFAVACGDPYAPRRSGGATPCVAFS